MLRQGGAGAVTIGHIKGFPVKLHFTLAFVLPFLAHTLAGSFRAIEVHSGTLVHPLAWGAILAAALFASVFLHELGHSLLALRLGQRVKGITLTMIGGVSEIANDPVRPRHEAAVAVIGPIVSVVLGGVFIGAVYALRDVAPLDVTQALVIVGAMNLLLGLFNLIPAFPLDGGRVLRAALASRMSRVRATKIAAAIGKLAAVAFGIFAAVNGAWLAMVVSLFVFMGAEREKQGVIVDATLAGLKVRDVLPPQQPLLAPAWTTCEDAYRRMLVGHVDAIAIADEDGKPSGAVSIRELAPVPVQVREKARLADVPHAKLGVATMAEELRPALMRMVEAGADAMPVMDEDGRLAGVLTQRDVAREMQLRQTQAKRAGASLRPAHP